jgi:DNA-binding MarR family transcriptional regulator
VSTGPQAERRIGLLRVAYDQALAAVLADVGPRHPVLRPAHLALFRREGVEGASVSLLAVHAGMTKQSMHELITHLEKHGYLVREPDPADTRARLVRLTPAGRRLEGEVHDAIGRVHTRWCEQLGSERFAALWSILGELTTAGPLPAGTPDADS